MLRFKHSYAHKERAKMTEDKLYIDLNISRNMYTLYDIKSRKKIGKTLLVTRTCYKNLKLEPFANYYTADECNRKSSQIIMERINPRYVDTCTQK